MITRILHSEMDPSNHKKSLVMKPGHRAWWCVWYVDAAYLLFQILGWGYETKSMIITTNRPIAEWGLVLGDPMAATAIIDCLMHHCTAIAIKGDSYRLKEHKQKNCLTKNLQAAKELKPEWDNCRGQDLSARGSTYLAVWHTIRAAHGHPPVGLLAVSRKNVKNEHQQVGQFIVRLTSVPFWRKA